MNKTWVTNVIQEGDDLVVVFPEELLNEINLQDGDLLSWEIDEENNRIILHKIKFVESN